jgi:hypothetical protein
MALAVRAAASGLPAIAERPQITRVAARPAAGTHLEIGDGQPLADRLFLLETGVDLDDVLKVDVQYLRIYVVHFGAGLGFDRTGM